MQGGFDPHWMAEGRMGRAVLIECLDGLGPAALVVESIADADAFGGVGEGLADENVEGVARG